MLSVTTSSWSTDLGYVANERYSFVQEAGVSSSKNRGNVDTAFETLSTAFFSPYWDFKLGHVEFPFSGALFTKNLGKSSSLVGPAFSGGAIAQWRAARTAFFEVKYLAGAAKTYSISRTDKEYSVDPGFEASNTMAWTLKQWQTSLLGRIQLSPIGYVDVQFKQQNVRAEHALKTLFAERLSNDINAKYTQKISDLNTFTGMLIAQEWQKSSFQNKTHSQQAVAGMEWKLTPSDRVEGHTKLSGLVYNHNAGIKSLNLTSDWKLLASHHWKFTAAAKDENDSYSLEGDRAARTEGSLGTFWRDYPRFEAGTQISLGKTHIQNANSALREIQDWKIEPSLKYFLDNDFGLGARAVYTLAKEKNAANASRIGLWIMAEWPATAAKKDL